jgi:2-iminobutanoate/2-iminopropanoate deaminase
MLRRTAVTPVLVLLGFVATADGLIAQSSRRYVEPKSVADTTGGPFSGGVLVGNTLYLSGTIGLAETGKVPASAEEEARLVLNNIKATLGAAGMSMDDLVTVQVFCSDVSHYDAFNRVYRTYFTKEFPARAFLGAGTLLHQARFEVLGIAVKR